MVGQIFIGDTIQRDADPTPHAYIRWLKKVSGARSINVV